jgi:hypothetical protein
MQVDTIFVPATKTRLIIIVSSSRGNAGHDGDLRGGTGVLEIAANVAVKAGGCPKSSHIHNLEYVCQYETSSQVQAVRRWFA